MADSNFGDGQRSSPSPELFQSSRNQRLSAMGDEQYRISVEDRAQCLVSPSQSRDTERGHTARPTREGLIPGPQDGRREGNARGSSDPDKSESLADAFDSSRHRSLSATTASMADARPFHKYLDVPNLAFKASITW
jgi:hypothetical protein